MGGWRKHSVDFSMHCNFLTIIVENSSKNNGTQVTLQESDFTSFLHIIPVSAKEMFSANKSNKAHKKMSNILNCVVFSFVYMLFFPYDTYIHLNLRRDPGQNRKELGICSVYLKWKNTSSTEGRASNILYYTSVLRICN